MNLIYAWTVSARVKKAFYYLSQNYKMPNIVTLNLFELGLTLYKLKVRKTPYSKLYSVKIDSLFFISLFIHLA